MSLMQLIEANHKQIFKSALGMTRRHDLANDLLSETLLNLHRKNTNVPDNDREFVLFFCKCMWIYKRSKRASYNVSITSKEIPIDNSYLCNIEYKEDSSLSTLIDQVDSFKNGLNELHKILFELHYENGMSYREIVNKYSKNLEYRLTIQGVYTLMKELNNKIKTTKWEF